MEERLSQDEDSEWLKTFKALSSFVSRWMGTKLNSPIPTFTFTRQSNAPSFSFLIFLLSTRTTTMVDLEKVRAKEASFYEWNEWILHWEAERRESSGESLSFPSTESVQFLVKLQKCLGCKSLWGSRTSFSLFFSIPVVVHSSHFPGVKWNESIRRGAGDCRLGGWDWTNDANLNWLPLFSSRKKKATLSWSFSEKSRKDKPRHPHFRFPFFFSFPFSSLTISPLSLFYLNSCKEGHDPPWETFEESMGLEMERLSLPPKLKLLSTSTTSASRVCKENNKKKKSPSTNFPLYHAYPN